MFFEFGEQKRFRLGLSKVEPVVIDQLLLKLEPLTPADVANLVKDSLPDGVRERAERHGIAGLAASGTGNGRH